MVDRREKLRALRSQKKDEVLLARVYEAYHAGRARPASTCFLSSASRCSARSYCGGGLPIFWRNGLSEREVCCYLPDYFRRELAL